MMHSMSRSFCLVLPAIAAAALAVSCTETTKPEIGRQGVGKTCKQISDCKAGLTCGGGTCKPLDDSGDKPQFGDDCNDDDDCKPELVCGRQKVCSDTKGRKQGESCGLTVDCELSLVCSGLAGVCVGDDGAVGTLNEGETCSDLLDCRRPFVCGIQDTCAKIPFYLGPDCSRSDNELGAFRVYFEVPSDAALETGEEISEFYRLPFPNELRVKDGKISVAGHPTAGEVLGVDMAGNIFTAIEEDADGFATNAPVFFRFSDAVDPQSLCLDEGSAYPPLASKDSPSFCTTSNGVSVYLVNIDTDSDDYGKHRPVQMELSRDAGQYICQNWLGIAPLDGRPLEHSTTYAAIVTSTVRDFQEQAPIQDQDFAAILSDQSSVAAMTPLRDWLNAKSIDPGSIAAAAVFTTGDPDAMAPKLRAAVRAEATPGFNGDAIACDKTFEAPAQSPCDDGLTGDAHKRGCFGEPAGSYDEIQGTYASPAFQDGDRPYRAAKDGGAFVLDATGQPKVKGTESLCYALAVPKTRSVDSPLPAIIYGHGTGGSYRSFLSAGTAELLTGLGYAVIGVDNVMHGRRQQPLGTPANAALWAPDPGRLFFNLANPRAARDNTLQGAADLFHLVYLLQVSEGLPARSVKFDPTQIHYIGHSQGTVIAPAFLAAEPELQTAVLSGAGAELALTILHKKSPNDVSRIAGTLLADNNLSRIHPMMGLMSLVFGPADSLNYAQTWVLEPTRGSPLPLMHVMGVGDTFTPDVTQDAQVRASGLPLVGTVERQLDGVGTEESEAKDNLNGVTAGAIQIRPDGGYDGHEVMFKHAAGQTALQKFFEAALLGSPVIQRD